MFDKILIANRGEIAVRILAACRELGVTAATLYSEADRGAPWVLQADESYPLAGLTAADTYLDQEAILAIAASCHADAIHPGYGFLSENPAFVDACTERGLLFIGPPAGAMRIMGSKAAARELAQQLDIPVIPGVDGAGLNPKQLLAAAERVGYPLLVKASAGGGGRGMRIVAGATQLEAELPAARNESLASFASDHLLLEKYFPVVHHVEIQLLGDEHGRMLHFFERECSIQRRYQKIVEESPAPILQDGQIRQRMITAAVRLAAAAGYVNAGTVEFVVDGDGRFYFLEMNTRLQVEHPVTEAITGFDLVAWQIRVAAGEQLPLHQADLRQNGHAIECRIYAEDPAQAFQPSTGEITVFRPPAGPGVRVDAGVSRGSVVSPYYDPMLAKLITRGNDRQEAIARMERALQDLVILGVSTNVAFLLAILAEPHFRQGDTPTTYLSQHLASWQPRMELDDTEWLAVAALESRPPRSGGRRLTGATGAAAAGEETGDPWRDLPGWRNVPR